MARKLESSKPAAESNSAAAQLAELQPDVSVTIADRALVVREYEFFEGLEVAHRATAFIADVCAMARADGTLRYDRIRRLFGVHREVVVAIAAQAAGVDPEWVAKLGRADAEQFMSAWFAANSGFFVHEVVVELREDRQRAAVLRLTGSSSSAGSLPPDLATAIVSADTPSGNSSASTTP